MDDNIYSSSAFIHLLRVKYNIGLQKLHELTKVSIYTLNEIRKGREQLGLELYCKLQNIGIEDKCCYDGNYEPYAGDNEICQTNKL